MDDAPGGPPSEGAPLLSLSEAERTLLAVLRDSGEEPLLESDLAARTGMAAEAVRGGLQRLRSKRLAVALEEHVSKRFLTARGREAEKVGLPERRLLDELARVPPGDAGTAGSSLSSDERSAAIGVLRRRGRLAPGFPLRREASIAAEDRLPEETALGAVSGGTEVDETIFRELRRRGLVDVEHETVRRWSASEEGRRAALGQASDSLGALTPALLSSGAWRGREFRPYDVRADVPRRSAARPHAYRAWLDEFEEILVGLGFSAAEGPLLESEFWNADVLYMPQEHPARSIHDVLTTRTVEGRGPPEALLERVAAVHEGRALPGEAAPISPGWRAPYDRALARRAVLRSQTTAVSARFLATRPAAPFRMYCLDRNFRRDAVDATHHVEFDQCEGVLGDASVTLRDLVGVFRSLAEAIGIRELKFRPSYFPFTEPSIEGYVRHPRIGWIEVFPGGLFRPEVLKPLGVEVPVAAWGIGVMRLAMVALGVSDIRELFSGDLDRRTRGPI